MDQLYLEPPQLADRAVGLQAQLGGPVEEPRHEEEVSRSRVQHRGTGEEYVGDGVADRSDADLVDRALLLEKLDCGQRPSHLRVVVI